MFIRPFAILVLPESGNVLSSVDPSASGKDGHGSDGDDGEDDIAGVCIDASLVTSTVPPP